MASFFNKEAKQCFLTLEGIVILSAVSFIPFNTIDEIHKGDDLNRILWNSLPETLTKGDIIVITHKVVSKQEGRLVNLDTVIPSDLAIYYANKYNKDPRHVEVVLKETASVVRMDRGIIISRTKHGFTCANAGVDISNAQDPNENLPSPTGQIACLLPLDPDKSAEQFNQYFSQKAGFNVPVIITDSFGRAWREGIVNVAIGVAGMCPFTDYRGQSDPAGYNLKVTRMASADAIAQSMELVSGKLNRCPAVLVKGFTWQEGNQGAKALIRPENLNMFP